MERGNGPRESRNRKKGTSVCRSLKKKDKVSMESGPQESRKRNSNRRKHVQEDDPFVNMCVCVHETVSERVRG